MKRFTTVSALAVCMVFLFSNYQKAIPAENREGKEKGSDKQAIVLGVDHPYWAPNRIGNNLTNTGHVVKYNQAQIGMEWPAGSGKSINYSSGLWLAGIKDGEIVTAASRYLTEFQPGTVSGHSIGVAGAPADPQDQRFKVYIINDEDVANPSGNPDYQNWPVSDGAPMDANGKPLLLGSSTAWAVFNDFDESLHGNVFDTKAMGVEVQMAAWAFDRSDAFGDMVSFKFNFINKSGKNISDAYAAFWADIDLGAPQDLVGCDPALSLGYVYQTESDATYGHNPPAIGYCYLQTPIVPSPGDSANVSGKKISGFKNLQMSAFAKQVCALPPDCNEPTTSGEMYNSIRGLGTTAGDPIIDLTTGQATPFWHSGDPVAGTGWLDNVPRDKKFLMSSGPFTFADGDTQEVVCAVVIAQGATGLESVRLLKENVALAQMATKTNL